MSRNNGRTLVTWQRTQLRILTAAVFAECGLPRSNFKNRTARYHYAYDCDQCEDHRVFAWACDAIEFLIDHRNHRTFLHKLTERGRDTDPTRTELRQESQRDAISARLGEGPATLRELADAAGVSTRTARRLLAAMPVIVDRTPGRPNAYI